MVTQLFTKPCRDGGCAVCRLPKAVPAWAWLRGQTVCEGQPWGAAVWPQLAQSWTKRVDAPRLLGSAGAFPARPAPHCAMQRMLFHSVTRCCFFLFLFLGAAPGPVSSPCCGFCSAAAGRELRVGVNALSPHPRLRSPQSCSPCHSQTPPSSLPQHPPAGFPGTHSLPGTAGGRQSPPQPLLSPGGSSPFLAPLQDSHKEALGERVCRRGTEAALRPREGTESSAGPARESIHQPEARGRGQGRAPQHPAPPPAPCLVHLKAEPCSCSVACTTSSFSSRCSEQVE